MSGTRGLDDSEALARTVRIGDGVLHVDLVDGRTLTARYDVFPEMRGATPEQLVNWELIADGYGIHWPDIDADLSVAGLVRDALSIVGPGAAEKVSTG